MCAINIGIGHDDDPLVTQAVLVIGLARATAERLAEIADLLIGPHFLRCGRGDVEDFTAQGQDRLDFAHTRLLR